MKYRASLLVLIAGLVTASSALAGGRDTAVLVARGESALRAGKYEKALRIFEKAREDTAGAESFDALVGLAQAHRCLFHRKESADLARAAVQLAATSLARAKALTLVGLTFYESPRGKQASAEWLAQNNEHAESYLRQALEESGGEYHTAEYF